jgi:hypothetical protein
MERWKPESQGNHEFGRRWRVTRAVMWVVLDDDRGGWVGQLGGEKPTSNCFRADGKSPVPTVEHQAMM